MRHPEFTDADWADAPTYIGPGIRELHQHARTTVLDFASLQMVADMQQESGAFRAKSGFSPAMAPIKLGDIPAAFIRVESGFADDYQMYKPPAPEILVVIQGILRVERRQLRNSFRANTGMSKPLASGDVITLPPGRTRLSAHGLDEEASSLALSMWDIHPKQTQLIVLRGIFNKDKEIDPAGRVNLPYEH